MPAKLEPVSLPPEQPDTEGTFAIMDRSQMTSLVRAMPDCQSAVLFCLAWHAAVQVRMKHGKLAGQNVARVSVNELARILDRSRRTVQYGLATLKDVGLVAKLEGKPGQTAVYRLDLGSLSKLRLMNEEDT